MEDRNPIISFKEADIVNGEATVIYGLDLDVYPGDFIYIVGKVGTGKTSIIRTMIAENPLTKGKGHVCGFNLVGIKEKDIPYLRRKMGVVFQDFQLLMDRSVEENLLFVLRATGWRNESEMADRISKVLEAV
ncbi:MAG: ATP-binding cassette domain-containing protein, partial [Bacteroidales bacterium]|nr:ATP-binding cassette domain-containing protein [Bacteroidales bacterium]